MTDRAEKSEEIVSTSELASVLGLTVQRIGQLQNEGVIPQHARGQYRLGASVQAYAHYLGSRRPTRDSEHSRLARVQADKIDRENRRARGELLPREVVDETLQGVHAAAVPLLDGMGGRLANELSGISEPAVIRERIQDECRAVRTAVADYLERRATALDAMQDRGERLAAAQEAQPLAVGAGEPELPEGECGTRTIPSESRALVDSDAGSMREPAVLASGRGYGNADE